MKKSLIIFFFLFAMAYFLPVAHGGGKLKIATYNTKLLPLPVMLRDHSPDHATFTPFVRARSIAGQFAGYDIVVFQEIIHPTDNWSIIHGMQQNGFLYHTDRPGECWAEGFCQCYLYTGGVRIFSKHPIIETRTIVFPRSFYMERLIAKGVVYAKIDMGQDSRNLHIFALHAQASREEIPDQELEASFRTKRTEQFDILKTFIDEQNTPSDEMILALGDFNVNSGPVKAEGKDTQLNTPDEFQALLGTLSAKPAGTFLDKTLEFSHDTETNGMTGNAYPGQEVRVTLDHILCVTRTNGNVSHPCPQDYGENPEMWIGAVRENQFDLSDHHAVFLDMNLP